MLNLLLISPVCSLSHFEEAPIVADLVEYTTVIVRAVVKPAGLGDLGVPVHDGMVVLMNRGGKGAGVECCQALKDGFGEIKSLEQLDPQVLKHGQFLIGFHPFGNHGCP